MRQYYVLIMVLGMLFLTRNFATGPNAGGTRFYDNPQTDLGEKSFFRKLLRLGKRKNNNKVYEERLKTYKVAPFAISFVLCCLTLLLYALFALSFLFDFSIGLAIGSFLKSTIALIIACSWYVLIAIYFSILHFL